MFIHLNAKSISLIIAVRHYRDVSNNHINTAVRSNRAFCFNDAVLPWCCAQNYIKNSDNGVTVANVTSKMLFIIIPLKEITKSNGL